MDAQAGLRLCCSQTLKTGFLTSRPSFDHDDIVCSIIYFEMKFLYALSVCTYQVNSLSPSVNLLITFANSLDPDQAQQNVRLDLDPICQHSCKNFRKN